MANNERGGKMTYYELLKKEIERDGNAWVRLHGFSYLDGLKQALLADLTRGCDQEEISKIMARVRILLDELEILFGNRKEVNLYQEEWIKGKRKEYEQQKS